MEITRNEKGKIIADRITIKTDGNEVVNPYLLSRELLELTLKLESLEQRLEQLEKQEKFEEFEEITKGG